MNVGYIKEPVWIALLGHVQLALKFNLMIS